MQRGTSWGDMVSPCRQEIAVRLPTGISCVISNEIPGITCCFFRCNTGACQVVFSDYVNVKIGTNPLDIHINTMSRFDRALGQAVARRLYSLAQGLIVPYKQKAELRGTGYQFVGCNATTIRLMAGRSHPVVLNIDEAVVSAKPLGAKGRTLELSGGDSASLGEQFAKLKSARPPGTYKERGVYKKYDLAFCKAGKKRKA